jgi:hypothetical protein
MLVYPVFILSARQVNRMEGTTFAKKKVEGTGRPQITGLLPDWASLMPTRFVHQPQHQGTGAKLFLHKYDDDES